MASPRKTTRIKRTNKKEKVQKRRASVSRRRIERLKKEGGVEATLL